MAGAFDDLVPKGGAGAADAAGGGGGGVGYFDDLVNQPWLSRAARTLPYGTGLLEALSGGKAAAGSLRGARDILDFGAEAAATGYDKAATALTGVSRQSQSDIIAGRPGGAAGPLKAQNAADLRKWEADNQDSLIGHGARLGGQMLITAPIGGVIAAPLKWAATSPTIAPLIGRAAPYLTALAESIGSGGMKTGMQAEAAREAAKVTAAAEKLAAAGKEVPDALAAAAAQVAANPVAAATIGQKAADVGMRVLGGGITGAAGGGVTGGGQGAAFGGGFGAALPAGFRGAGAAYQVAAPTIARILKRPQIAQDAETILQAGGYRAGDIPALRAALEQRGPTIVQGVKPDGSGGASSLTVPQVLMNEGVSQFSRTLNNAHNAGVNPQLAAIQAQQTAQQTALGNVGNLAGTVQDARELFGSTVQKSVLAGDKAAKKRTKGAFEGVDPAGDAKIFLPVDEIRAAAAKYVNPDIHGAGTPAAIVAQRAENIGTELLEPVTAATAAAAQPRQTLAQKVRAMGGIDAWSQTGQDLAGELKDLRQTKGMRGIVKDGSGRSPEKLAEELFQSGHLPDEDPVTLLNHLRDPDLSGAAAELDDAERAWAAIQEHNMGDAPGAIRIPKAVNFETAQDLRSFIGEQAREARLAGKDKLATGLEQQQREIDARVAGLVGGDVRPGEYFPADMQQHWKYARDLKRQQVDTYRTGPQAGFFRMGSDQLPSLNRGEAAPAFFNPKLSQVSDIEGFNKIANDETRGLLKDYAVRDAASQTDRFGNLTNDKYNKWMRARSGAIEGLFDTGERAQLSGVGANVRRADEALHLGMGPNSASVKNLLGLGLLDAPIVDLLANKIPVVGKFTGPALEALKKSAYTDKVNRLSTLMSDPAKLEEALRQLQLSHAAGQMGMTTGAAAAGDIARRALPLLGGRL